MLRESLVEYLMNEGFITSIKKYNIQLKKEYLKVNKKEMSPEIHEQCLNLFSEVYGHGMNSKSLVLFKKSKNISTFSISIHN